MRLPEQIFVCDHALDRWRQRVALYGDEGEGEVVAALRESAYIGEGDFLPLVRRDNSHYFYHRKHDCYFVLEVETERARVVTVVVDNECRPPVKLDMGKKQAQIVSALDALKASDRVSSDAPKVVAVSVSEPENDGIDERNVMKAYPDLMKRLRGVQKYLLSFTDKDKKKKRKEYDKVLGIHEDLARQVMRYKPLYNETVAKSEVAAGLKSLEAAVREVREQLDRMSRRIDSLEERTHGRPYHGRTGPE